MNWLIRISKADVFLNSKQVLHSVDWTMKNGENSSKEKLKAVS